MNEDKQARDDGVVKILAHLFNDMCDGDPDFADPVKRRAVSVAYFAQWLQENVGLKNGVTICGDLGVVPEAWEMVQHIAHSGNYIPILGVWPRILLGEQTVPKHPLRSFHLLAILEWEDGCMVPISVYTPKEFAPNAVLTDGIVASMLQQQISAAVTPLMDQGLDGMHEHMTDTYGGEDVFNTLMGTMLKVIPQLDKRLQPYLHKWMRLFQGFIRPPIPPHIQTHIENVRRKLAAKGETGDKPKGGWDT